MFHQMMRKKRRSTVDKGEGAPTTTSKFNVTSQQFPNQVPQFAS